MLIGRKSSPICPWRQAGQRFGDAQRSGLPAAWALALLAAIPPCVGTEALDAVVVTATRVQEPADRVPAAISVVDGSELEVRGATNLNTALGLVSGVEAPAGGDAGPSGAVLSFWGLHELDAFLLVVDGVPAGGTYNPAISSLDFTGIKRIEILKGAAPVMYGAASFVGVVHVIHYPAGEAADMADLAYGSYGSVRGSVSAALSAAGDLRQSVALDGQHTGFADGREEASRAQALYRSAIDLGEGSLSVDADLTHLHDRPTSPVLRAGAGLTPLSPIDANFNPADARLDEDRQHINLGYSSRTNYGTWDTRLSYARTRITDIRAFLHPNQSGTADVQNQDRRLQDGYFDTHLAASATERVTLLLGVDLLYGRGRQTSRNGNGAYTVPLDGSVLPPPASRIPANEIITLDDRRTFVGQYAQIDWKPDNRWDVLAGVRLNEAYERKDSSDLTSSPTQRASAAVSKTMVRPTEILGISYRAWVRGIDEAVIYADYRNAFKPAAIDFGPDYTPDLLSPETAGSYELGLRGTLAQSRLNYEAELFALDFRNLVVPTSSGALANAAGEQLRGLEAQARYTLAPDLTLAATASYHDATFSHYLFFDGAAAIDLSARQLPLSPHVLAAAGVLYTPVRGLGATAVVHYAGRRYLDEENAARVGGYSTVDATLDYRLGHFRVALEGTNLSNRRPPVTASEFGSSSFYLLPSRMIWLRVAYSLPRASQRCDRNGPAEQSCN